VCRGCVHGRVESHPDLRGGVEGCGGADSMAGWPMFSFSCRMLLGENESQQDTKEAYGGIVHLDVPAAALLTSCSQHIRSPAYDSYSFYSPSRPKRQYRVPSAGHSK